MKQKHRKNNSNRLFLIFIIVLLIAAGVFLINMLKQNRSADVSGNAVRTNISAISTFDYSEVTTIEARIKQIEDSETKGNFNVDKDLSKDQYRKIFSTSIIMGDSITEGISSYGYLGEENVFCGIGASIMHGDDLFVSAAATYPKFAFMAFGMNDMGNFSGDSAAFAEKYTRLIKDFQKTSPDTRIYVNSITPPTAAAMEKNSSISHYKEFNNAMKKMCQDLNVTYIDNVYILEENPGLYAGDGIHATGEYYPIWLNNMILKAGL